MVADEINKNAVSYEYGDSKNGTLCIITHEKSNIESEKYATV